MKRLTIFAVGIGLLAVACADRAGSLGPAPSGPPPVSPSVTATPSATPSTTPSPSNSPTSSRTFTFEVWFLSHGLLFVTQRTEPYSVAVGRLALDGLANGPTTAEGAAGVTSAIPSDVQTQITALVNGQATVDVSSQFLQGDDSGVRLRRAQVVYTLTQYSTIRKVVFSSEGTQVGTKAWARGDFQDLLPAILVESPVIGQQVSDPVTVSGTANVFEATVSLRILDEDGNELANTFTTATCGTGCRGDYSVSVPYTVDHQQTGVIEVFESSAMDGSPINVVRIPVTLTP